MEKKILSILKTVFEEDSIDETCSQVTCEQWDSLNHLNLVVELESEFGISLEPEEIAAMVDYSKIIQVVKSKYNGK